MDVFPISRLHHPNLNQNSTMPHHTTSLGILGGSKTGPLSPFVMTVAILSLIRILLLFNLMLSSYPCTSEAKLGGRL
jgi:hypothetical protein